MRGCLICEEEEGPPPFFVGREKNFCVGGKRTSPSSLLALSNCNVHILQTVGSFGCPTFFSHYFEPHMHLIYFCKQVRMVSFPRYSVLSCSWCTVNSVNLALYPRIQSHHFFFFDKNKTKIKTEENDEKLYTQCRPVLSRNELSSLYVCTQLF